MKRTFLTLCILAVLMGGCAPAAGPAPATRPPADTAPAAPASANTATLKTATASPTNPPTPSPASTETRAPTSSPAAPTATTVPLTATRGPTATPSFPWAPGEVRVFPGPKHYTGDVLSVEIPVYNLDFRKEAGATASLILDGGEPVEIQRTSTYDVILDVGLLVFPNVFDTAGRAGKHTLRIQTSLQGVRPLDVSFEVEVLPASQRPEGEKRLQWETVTMECCVVNYLSGTAAARDIEAIRKSVEESAAYVEEITGIRLRPQSVRVTLLDNVWGNGGYRGLGGVVLQYLDRDYTANAGGIEVALRHEITHDVLGQTVSSSLIGPLIMEGAATYVAGGYGTVQPIPQVAAALVAMGYYVPPFELDADWEGRQHEMRYLEGAAVVAYLVERYGWDGFLKFYRTAGNPRPKTPGEWLRTAVEQNFGQSPEEFEAAFLEWAERQDPGEQVESLRLAIALQDLRREYQRQRAPYQSLHTLGPLVEQTQLAMFAREPDSIENIAIETLLASAQRALYLEKDYAQVETFLEAVRATLAGDFASPPAGDYLNIVELLDAQDYEVVSIDIQGSEAEVQAIRKQPDLEVLHLGKTSGEWQLLPNH